MLIAVKNPDLYRAWIAAIGGDTAEKRLRAYVAASRGEWPRF